MGNWCDIYETGSKPKGGYGIQLPGLDMPTKILTAVDTVRNIANGMKGIIQGRISAAQRRVIRRHHRARSIAIERLGKLHDPQAARALAVVAARHADGVGGIAAGRAAGDDGAAGIDRALG